MNPPFCEPAISRLSLVSSVPGLICSAASGTQRAYGEYSGHRCLQPLAADISHHDQRRSVKPVEYLVEVTANFGRRSKSCLQVKVFKVREFDGHQLRLHLFRRFHFRGEPLLLLRGNARKAQHQHYP